MIATHFVSLYYKLKCVFLKYKKVSRFFPIFLVALTVASGVVTYFSITSPERSSQSVFLLLNLDLILGLLLTVIVLRKVIQLWVERRKGLAGSGLHVRLSFLFAVVSVTPTILVAFFSMFFFNLGMENWFHQTISTTIGESSYIANTYLGEHKGQIKKDIYTLKFSLETAPKLWVESSEALSRFLSKQIELRGLTEGLMIKEDFTILARSDLTFAMELESIPEDAWEKAKRGQVAIFVNQNHNRVRALLKINLIEGAYLYLGKYVEERVVRRISKIEAAAQEYNERKDNRSNLQITFALMYIIVSVLLLLAAIWVGLLFGGYLAKPIRKLIIAAEKIRLGDVQTLVEVDENHRELGTLARAFNRMLQHITLQASELMERNLSLYAQNTFIKAVLHGVTAGVISVNEEGVVELMNPSAERILEMVSSHVEGQLMHDVFPFFTDFLDKAKQSESSMLTANILLTRKGHTITLDVRVSRDIEGAHTKYIFTFDNISELVSAQRKAAWSDVARRIAHEIKNPLTPIQLSAERVKKKYGPQITVDKDIFDNCILTIVSHVRQIGQMVDEFANFAKMPSAKLKKIDINGIVTGIISLQQLAHEEVSYLWQEPQQECLLMLDANLISQALTNLLLNAYESFELHHQMAPCIRISLSIQESQVRIRIEDNGKGLPKENREKLTEPYMTTRPKGTGLGLAIVKHIMEEHKGKLRLRDSADLGGAQIDLILPY